MCLVIFIMIVGVIVNVCDATILSLFFNNRNSQRFVLVTYTGALRGHPLKLERYRED